MPTRHDRRGAGRVAAAIALFSAWLAFPLFRYARAADAWDLVVVIGSLGALGAIHGCFDWWSVQRGQEKAADHRIVWKAVLAGALLCGAWSLVVQAVLVHSSVLPLALFEEPRPGDEGYWWFACSALLLSPLGEEILFRAWLLGPAWHARSLRLRLAVSCLVFPFGHLLFEPGQMHENLFQLCRMLLLFVPSLVFVWVWLRTRSLLACYLTHAISNAIPSLPWWLE